MFNKLMYFCIFLIISNVKCEEGEQYWSSLTKDGIFYRILYSHSFNLDNPPRILQKGAIKEIPQMERLLLYDTKIQNIEPGALEDLPNLKSFEVTIGNLTEVGSGIFNDLELTNLEIDRCNLETIASDTFDGLTKLQSVHLSGNKLKRWNPDWFAKTPSLKNIYMNSNQIEEIPANVVKNLEEIDNIFLYDNKISKIDDNAFNGVKRIGILQLTKNNLETFSGNIIRGIEIDELRLSNNKIRCLPEEELDEIFIAEVTQLQGNPLDPKCLERIKKWVKDHRANVIF